MESSCSWSCICNKILINNLAIRKNTHPIEVKKDYLIEINFSNHFKIILFVEQILCCHCQVKGFLFPPLLCVILELQNRLRGILKNILETLSFWAGPHLEVCAVHQDCNLHCLEVDVLEHSSLNIFTPIQSKKIFAQTINYHEHQPT